MNHRLAMRTFLRRTCLTLHCNAQFNTNVVARRFFQRQSHTPLNSKAMTTTTETAMSDWCSSKRFYSKFVKPPDTGAPALCDRGAYELVLKLNDMERLCLKTALDKYEAARIKAGFEGKLAATQWRTRFGRLSKVPPPLSNVDPTGSFCTFPEDWLRKKAEENAVQPTTKQLTQIFFVNAAPFVVFGFLDNFCMITAGDSIENVFGTFMCISTMAAAGLGNTISDILGIGSAFYVERFCAFMGLKPPDLGPIQMEMKSTRRSANLGRIIGITLGCLLGMCPLLFIGKSDELNPTT